MSQQGRLFAVWLGMLSGLSGFVNISSLLLFATPATHMTGNLSQFLLAVVSGQWEGALSLLGVIGCFVCGGVLSGLLFSQRVFRWGNRYGVLLVCFGVLLSVSYFWVPTSCWLYILAVTVGTQNGMFIFYRGMIVRTSHFTGYLTDTGFAIGRYLRGHKEDGHKIVFYVMSMVCFLAGGLLAYEIVVTSHEMVLLAIAVSYVICGLYYFTLRHIHWYDNKEETDV